MTWVISPFNRWTIANVLCLHYWFSMIPFVWNTSVLLTVECRTTSPMGNRWQAQLNPSPPPFPFQLSPSLWNFYPFFPLCFLFYWSQKINMASCVASIKWSQINTSSAFAGLMQPSEVTEREAFVGKLPSDWCGDPEGGEGLTAASDEHNTFSPMLIKIAGLVSPPVLCAVHLTVSRIIMLAFRNPPDSVSCH